MARKDIEGMGRSIHYCQCGEEIHDEMTECIACWNRRGSLPSVDRKVWTEELVPLREALKIMTDQWIESGNYSAHTVMDLRDALIEAMRSTDGSEPRREKEQ